MPTLLKGMLILSRMQFAGTGALLTEGLDVGIHTGPEDLILQFGQGVVGWLLARYIKAQLL